MLFSNQSQTYQTHLNTITLQTAVYPTLLDSNPASLFELALEKQQQRHIVPQKSQLPDYMNQSIQHLSPQQPEIRHPASSGFFPQGSSAMSSLSLSYPTTSRPAQMQNSYSQPQSQTQSQTQPRTQQPQPSQSFQLPQQPSAVQSASSTPAYFSPPYGMHDKAPSSANTPDISPRVYFDGTSSHQSKMANQAHQLTSYSSSSGFRSASMGRRNSLSRRNSLGLRARSSSASSRPRSRRASGARRRGSSRASSGRDSLVERSDRVYKSVNNQNKISPSCYLPADQNADIAGFNEEDVYILKSLLPLAESHKWKYLSSKLSRLQSRKFNAEFCARKFHQMYRLPFNESNSLLKVVYSLKDKTHKEPAASGISGINYEGLIGSSLSYILCRDGWKYVD